MALWLWCTLVYSLAITASSPLWQSHLVSAAAAVPTVNLRDHHHQHQQNHHHHQRSTAEDEDLSSSEAVLASNVRDIGKINQERWMRDGII